MRKVLILIFLCSFAGIALAEEYRCDYDGKSLNTNLYSILSRKGIDNSSVSGIVCFTSINGQIRLKLKNGMLENFIESIRYSKDKKPISYIYTTDYEKFFMYNKLYTDILNNNSIIKEMAQNIDYTLIMYHPVTYNKVLDITIKDKAGSATFYHNNNIAQYILPINTDGLSNTGKYFDEQGRFLADITVKNGIVINVKCSNGKILPKNELKSLDITAEKCQ